MLPERDNRGPLQHTPEQLVAKHREANWMLNSGKHLTALRHLKLIVAQLGARAKDHAINLGRIRRLQPDQPRLTLSVLEEICDFICSAFGSLISDGDGGTKEVDLPSNPIVMLSGSRVNTV